MSSLGSTRSSAQDLSSALSYMSSPSTEIISMTVTEKGYYQNSTTGDLDFFSPDVLHDVQQLSKPDFRDISSLFPLKTTVGLIVASLRLRQHCDVGQGKSITLLCCDNLPHNGNVLQNLVTEMSSSINDPSFNEFVQNQVTFPNSMVDRITPAADEKTALRIEEKLNIKDSAPVQAEDFYQWVVEDKFAGDRPQWEIVPGVTFVDDVTKFENMKLRLLNGSHTALSYISSLLHASNKEVTVDKVMADEDVSRFVQQYMKEIKPTLKGGPEGEENVDLYCDSLMERFRNTEISDLVSRLCQDGSKKFQGFVVPPLKEMLQEEVDTKMVKKVVASWYVYLGEWEVIDDPSGSALVQLAREKELKQFVYLGIGDFVNEKFVDGVAQEVQRLKERGPREFLREI